MDLLMPDGTQQCTTDACQWAWNNLHNPQTNENSNGLSYLGASLISFFLLSLAFLVSHSYNRRRNASLTDLSLRSTVLVSAYERLIWMALVWALLSWLWYILATAPSWWNERAYQEFLVVSHMLLQGFKTGFHTFVFLYLADREIGLSSMRRNFRISLLWGVFYAIPEILGLQISRYRQVWPFIRAASYGAHTCLYSYLLFRFHFRGALNLRTRNRASSKLQSRSSHESLRHSSSDQALPAMAAPPQHDTGNGFSDVEKARLNKRAAALSEGSPLLEAIHYWRPIHPFGAVALLYVSLGFITSVMLAAQVGSYGCVLAAEVIVLYAVLPFALYRTLLADSRLCQNLTLREEGYKNMAHIGVGELKLGAVISGGSAGTVVQATYRGRPVCVKKYVVSCLHVENLRKFEMETSMLGRLNHENLVRVIGICNDNPYLYLVMEYCSGGDLYSYIHNPVKVLDYNIALVFMRDIASALEYIHRKGVIHRDIKSLNILLDQNMRAKLADFELSHFTGTIRVNNSTTPMAGTLAWLSPELVYGVHSVRGGSTQGLLRGICCPCVASETDPEEEHYYKSDIYAYGVIMYELLTRNDPPLSDADLAHVIRQSMLENFDPMRFAVETSSDGTRVPNSLQNLLLRCVSITPAERPSFSHILRELNKLIDAHSQ